MLVYQSSILDQDDASDEAMVVVLGETLFGYRMFWQIISGQPVSVDILVLVFEGILPVVFVMSNTSGAYSQSFSAYCKSTMWEKVVFFFSSSSVAMAANSCELL
jgi:hypothetical protein